MDITDFNEPEKRPVGMLRGYERAEEKEIILAKFLSEYIEQGSFDAIKPPHKYPTMVTDGLLKETPDGYLLTKKAIGLLYSVYGK